jgi:hypothetical protein
MKRFKSFQSFKPFQPFKEVALAGVMALLSALEIWLLLVWIAG